MALPGIQGELYVLAGTTADFLDNLNAVTQDNRARG